MIYNIISVEEYANLLVDARRELLEIAAESTLMEKAEEDRYKNYKQDVTASVKLHLKMVKTYIKSANKKKKSGLYNEAKQDLTKAKDELEATEKTLRSMESTNSDAIKSVISSLFLSIFVASIGFATGLKANNDMKHKYFIDPETGREMSTKTSEYIHVSKNGEETKVDPETVRNIGLGAGTVAAINATYTTLKMVMRARKEMKKGASAADAFNQFKIVYLQYISRMKKSY